MGGKDADCARFTSETCPECGAVGLLTGAVFGTLTFLADEERPTPLRCFFAFWLRGTGAKASATTCRKCGWMSVDPRTLVEPAPPPLADRLE